MSCPFHNKDTLMYSYKNSQIESGFGCILCDIIESEKDNQKSSTKRIKRNKI